MGLGKKINKWLNKLVLKFYGFVDDVDREIDRARERFEKEMENQDAGGIGGDARPASPASDGGIADPSLPAQSPENPPSLSAYPLGIASCWHGANASERMMNILSPKMSDETFGKRLAWMKGKGCTVAHVILVNAADGEAGGYAAWNDSDRPKMLKRWEKIRDAGLILVPWIITDDSKAYRDQLFANADKLVGKMATFLTAECPYVVLGLEMDEDKSVTADQWKKVRDAVRKRYKGPLGVHHCSGSSFKFAGLGDIILGQLDPGCTEAQVKAQIKAIKAKGKRAVGFEYSRGPSRKLCLAALEAGAEGVGNWDGGSLPKAVGIVSADDRQETLGSAEPEDAVDYASLNWSYGGFNGKGGKLNDKARIYNLQVSSSGLSYKWMSGGCENLDRNCSHNNPCCTCALFCLVDGKWVGGKVDHISTDRTTRDFKNIDDGYGGWRKSAVTSATAYAFVILDDGGRNRTNVITFRR